MDFYFIVSNSCDGTLTLVYKLPGQESKALFGLSKSEVYQIVSVHMDSIMYGGDR